MTFEILFVLLALLGMVIALVLDKMRPGMVLFSVVVLFLCAGILTPKEMLEGFSNKGMMTVAMLFLVSEGIRQSGALGQIIKKLLPQGKTTVFKAQFRMLPTIAFISAFLNNTPVVVIFAPIIKLDMFFFVSITTIIMAWTKIFPARKYTKYISWDILITIACAFAISKAMVNSGVADAVAHFIIGMSHHYGPHNAA
jgi:di/tricarboxylate transporter